MKKHGKKRFYHIFNLLLVLLTIITLFMVYNTNILNITYFTVISIILILVNLAIIGGINHKSIFALLLGIIIFALEGIVNFYLFKTNNFLDKINNKTEIEVYRVVTLTSAAKDLEDIGNIGVLTNGDDGYKKAVDNITDTIPNTTAFTDTSALTAALLAEKIPAILLDASTDVVLRENDEAYNASTKYIYEYEVKIKTNVNASSKNILKETFSIYISGVDTYNKIATKTRSDVNIVLTVNPVTKKIVMTHIPRDYYVTLAGINSKDKLTHASLYGIDTAMKTVEDLLDTKIDYYVRLNFTSLVKIVDLLGGLDVNSKYSFETGIYDDKMTKTYKFKQGLNNKYYKDMTGELLSKGYRSYNAPYFEEVKKDCGYKDEGDYYHANRYHIILALDRTITDIKGVKFLIDYHDSVNLCDQIGARCDIGTDNPFGAIDAKITNRTMIGNMQAMIRYGPPYMDGVSLPFQFGSKYRKFSHFGIPEKFEYKWIIS